MLAAWWNTGNSAGNSSGQAVVPPLPGQHGLKLWQADVEQADGVSHVLPDRLPDGADHRLTIAGRHPFKHLLADRLEHGALQGEELVVRHLAQVGVEQGVELLQNGVSRLVVDCHAVERFDYVDAHRGEHGKHHPEVRQLQQLPHQAGQPVVDVWVLGEEHLDVRQVEEEDAGRPGQAAEPLVLVAEQDQLHLLLLQEVPVQPVVVPHLVGVLGREQLQHHVQRLAGQAAVLAVQLHPHHELAQHLLHLHVGLDSRHLLIEGVGEPERGVGAAEDLAGLLVEVVHLGQHGCEPLVVHGAVCHVDVNETVDLLRRLPLDSRQDLHAEVGCLERDVFGGLPGDPHQRERDGDVPPDVDALRGELSDPALCGGVDCGGDRPPGLLGLADLGHGERQGLHLNQVELGPNAGVPERTMYRCSASRRAAALP